MTFDDLTYRLDEAASFETFLLVGFLMFLGSRISGGDPVLERIGVRLAGAAFFLFVILLADHWSPATSGEWLGILLKSLMAAGVVLGTAWVVLPPLRFVYAHSIGAVLEMLSEASRTAHQRRRERVRQRQARLDQRRHDKEWRRNAPQRERDRQAAEARAQEQAAMQKRREDARASCQLLYRLHAPEIGERLSQSAFDEFLKTYMGNERPPEIVEERAGQLRQMIEQHKNLVRPPERFATLGELTKWFEQQQTEIETCPDERMRRSLLVQLKQRYSELCGELLEEI